MAIEKQHTQVAEFLRSVGGIRNLAMEQAAEAADFDHSDEF
jgi:hypothetical protein